MRAAAVIAALLGLAGCVESPPTANPPPVSCKTSDECLPGQQCVDNNCFGDATAEFAAELFAPQTRTDMLPRAEVKMLDISQNHVDVMFGHSVEVTGRVLLRSTDDVSVAARVVFQRPSRIPGAPDYVVTVDAVPGKRRGEIGFRARLLPNEGSETGYDVTVYPDDGTLSAPPPGTLPPNMLAPPAVIPTPLQLVTSVSGYDVALDRGGLRTLTGQAVDAVGRGMPGMLVSAWARRKTTSPLELVSSTAKTDDDGRFEIYLGLSSTTFELRIEPGVGVKAPALTRKGLRLSSTVSPTVLEAIRYPALPKLTRYQLPVVGFDLTGSRRPALGATVIFDTDIPAGTDVVTYQTQSEVNVSGVAEVDLIPGSLDLNRTYAVTVLPLPTSLPGSRWDAQVSAGPPHPDSGDGGVLPEITLPNRVQVTGTVRQADGMPAARVTVRPQLSAAFLAEMAGDVDLVSGVRLPEVTTADTGAFSLFLDARLAGTPAQYDLELIPPNGSALPRWSRDGVSTPVTSADVKLDLGPIALPSSSLVSGTVRDENGVPVAGAEVRVYMRETATSARQRAIVNSDADGKITLVLPAP